MVEKKLESIEHAEVTIETDRFEKDNDPTYFVGEEITGTIKVIPQQKAAFSVKLALVGEEQIRAIR